MNNNYDWTRRCRLVLRTLRAQLHVKSSPSTNARRIVLSSRRLIRQTAKSPRNKLPRVLRCRTPRVLHICIHYIDCFDYASRYGRTYVTLKAHRDDTVSLIVHQMRYYLPHRARNELFRVIRSQRHSSLSFVQNTGKRPHRRGKISWQLFSRPRKKS